MTFSKYSNLDCLDPTKERNGSDAPTGGAICALALIVIGMILGAPLGAAMSAGFRAYDSKPAIVNTYLRADYCMTCHIARSEPAIKNLKQYKETHPALSQKRILQDLIATTGANP